MDLSPTQSSPIKACHYRSREIFEREIGYFQSNWFLICHLGEGKPDQTLFRVGPGYYARIDIKGIGFEVRLSPYEIYNPELNLSQIEYSVLPEVSEFEGFVFVRNKGKDCLKHAISDIFRDEFKNHKVSCSVSKDFGQDVVNANWKSMIEISLEETHVDFVHPQLKGVMMGSQNYVVKDGVRRWDQLIRFSASSDWRFRFLNWAYDWQNVRKIDRRWVYYWLLPSAEIELYPEQCMFTQFVPISPTQTIKRWVRLSQPGRSPIQYLIGKVNHAIQKEIDQQDMDFVTNLRPDSLAFEGSGSIFSTNERLVEKFHLEVIKNIEA